MRQIASILLILGIGSCVVHFLGMEMKLLRWITTWGEGAAWGIRAAFIAAGAGLWFAGAPKQATETRSTRRPSAAKGKPE